MDRQIERRSSAFYQRRHRERLREQGLLKKELWVLPEYADDLAAIERLMRRPRDDAGPADDGDIAMSAKLAIDTAARAAIPIRGDAALSSQPWSALGLCEALMGASAVREGAVTVELIEGAEPGLYLTMHDYGDLPLFMAVVGQQIVVEALLWPLAHVRDVAYFNDEVLRTHKLFPLSTLGIQTIDGEAVYIMFGSLSSHSTLADVLFEVETLADNVIRATEAYALHLREVV